MALLIWSLLYRVGRCYRSLSLRAGSPQAIRLTFALVLTYVVFFFAGGGLFALVSRTTLEGIFFFVALLVLLQPHRRALAVRLTGLINSLDLALYVGAIVLACLLVASGAYLMVNVPAHGWDVLDYWAPVAIGNMDSDFSGIWPDGNKHSVLNSNILLMGDRYGCASQYCGQGARFSPYIPLIATLALGVWGLFKELEFSSAPSAFATFCLVITPILENHMLIYGYAELALAVTSFLFALLISSPKKMLLDWIVIVLLAFCVVLIKNYGLVIVLALTICSYSSWMSMRAMLLLASCFAVFSILIMSVVYLNKGLDIGAGIFRVSLDPYKNNFIILNKQFAINFDNFSPMLVFHKLVDAVLKFSSFSVFIVTSSVLLFFSGDIAFFRGGRFFNSAVVFFFLMIFCLPLATTVTNFKGIILADTSLTRFYLTVFIAGLPLFIRRLHNVSRGLRRG